MTTSRTALIVRGGWDGHVPVQATDSFVPFLQDNGFDVRVSNSTDAYLDADAMAATDLVVQCVTMSTISAEALAGLTSAVEHGAGLAGWHGGIADSFHDRVAYAQLVGGQFVCHPAKAVAERTGDGTDVFLPHRIEIVDTDHPITQGTADFDLVTEQYWVLSDAYNHVLATTTHPSGPERSWREPVTVPTVWTRQWGDGRVFVATPGHDMHTLQHPHVRALIERGLLWAARA